LGEFSMFSISRQSCNTFKPKRIGRACGFVFFCLVLLFSTQQPHILHADLDSSQSLNPQQLKVIAVGDIMLGSNFPSHSSLPPNDGADLLSSAIPYFQDADILFGNLEGVLLSGSGTPKAGAGTGKTFAFKSPDHYVTHLKNAGFNLLNLANNHSNDFGAKGRRNTMRLLDEAGIHYAGLLECPTKVFEVNGFKVGFCGFAPNVATLQLNDYNLVRQTIQSLKQETDIVIVSFHSGAEGTARQHITRKTEYYLRENRGNPYRFARVAIDAGADLLLGHGPHVPRAVDLYKDRLIVYSMGNFATYKLFALSGALGLSPIFSINLAADGSFIDAQIISMIQKGRGGPVPDENNAALKKIIKLTRADFPDLPLQITDDGQIKRIF
jgi:poly-gamma-glutamate capsule biosynthesis protein CapA/YwtB (metallophosphatase superfamily)